MRTTYLGVQASIIQSLSVEFGSLDQSQAFQDSLSSLGVGADDRKNTMSNNSELKASRGLFNPRLLTYIASDGNFAVTKHKFADPSMSFQKIHGTLSRDSIMIVRSDRPVALNASTSDQE